MYPNLTGPLLLLLGAALGVLGYLVVRRPVLRRLALRQVARRRTEAALVMIGSLLGTAIIVGSFVVGDSLNWSVRQVAYDTLGPVDEKVVSTSLTQGLAAAQWLSDLQADPDVDGVLLAYATQTAVVRGSGAGQVAEPRAYAWEIDAGAAGRFGAPDDAGLPATNPARGEVYVNSRLARAVDARVGDVVTMHLFGRVTQVVVARILPEHGLAGTGFGATVNRNVFVAPGVLVAAAVEAAADPTVVTFVSNRGGVEAGEALTAAVTGKIRRVLGPLSAVALVDTPKQDVLEAAELIGDTLGAMFLFIGSFSIVAGVLLLVNIFVMLAEERKGQLGMLRAIGLKRRPMVTGFVIEGAVYGVVASLVGVVAGLGVGFGVATIAGRMFAGPAQGDSALQIGFAATPVSLFNGFAIGLLISLLTVLATSARISRLNVIAAIRDLPANGPARSRRLRRIVATAAGVAVTGAAIPAVASSSGAAAYTLPALALLLFLPLLTSLLPRRFVYTGASLAVLVWALTANLVRPDVYDDQSMATYIAQGMLLTFSAVFLLTENQHVVLWPLRRLIDRPTENGLAARLAVAYPLARRFRTGATLVMYSLVVFVLVLIVEISAIVSGGVDTVVRDATAGYGVRVDFNPDVPVRSPDTVLREGRFAGRVDSVTPLLTATARTSDPGQRTDEALEATVVGVRPDDVRAIGFDKRLAGLADDAAVWQLIASDPRYAVLDPNFGAVGGPPVEAFGPGDVFTVTDPRTSRTQQKVIAGVLRNGIPFYGAGGTPVTVFPVVLSADAVTSQFGDAARYNSAFLRPAAGVDMDRLVADLQGEYLASSLVATSIQRSVEQMFDASNSFFELMQGYLALGLVVCITGLGVVMVRAVRERRRTIGVLRALGFRARTVQRSFLVESSFVAVEGVVVGTVLGVVTTWLLYQNSSAFATIEGPFPIAWATIGITVAATFLASLLATFGPARRAARIRPAVAVRVSD